MPVGDPSSQRRRLKAELRKARDATDLTQREVAERLDWSLSKLIRVETGAVGLSVTDLKAMLQLYGVTDKRLVNELSDAARGSKGSSWWSRYRDVLTPQFALYLGHEGSASSIRVFHPFLIPGLLQTDEYALELLVVHRSPEEARRVVDLRMQRQKSLIRHTGSPDMTFILNEESLYRCIGGPAVMRRQLEHLLDISNQAAGRVQILPFSAGAHPGLLGPFILLRFAGSAENMLFVEGMSGDLVSRDDEEKIAQFAEHFEAMSGRVLSDDQSKVLLAQLIEKLRREESIPGEGPDSQTRPLAGSLGTADAGSRPADAEEDRWPPGVSHLAPNQVGTQRQFLASSAGWSATGTTPCGLSQPPAAWCSAWLLASPWGSAFS